MSRKSRLAWVPLVAVLAATLSLFVPRSADAQFGETGQRQTYLGVCTGCWYLDWPYSQRNCAVNQT